MSGKLDKILVVDIEATCWEGKPPAGEQNEIIEVGICLPGCSIRGVDG